MILNKFSDFYERYEKYISPIGLIYGFIFTSLTLTRVDAWLENFWIVVHLLLVSFGILALTHYENRANQRKVPEVEKAKFLFFLTLIIQFAFGGLFSTFFVFYLRSSSLVQSWFFVIILLILLIGNELWKKHYQRLAFQISVLFLSVYLFLIFLLPILFHRLGDDLFILSGVLSLLFIVLFLLILKSKAHEKFKNDHNVLSSSVIIIFVVMNILYFTNIIPPIPLSLKSAGVYHNIVKVSGGNYRALGESPVWYDKFINNYPAIHLVGGEAVYAFSSIFSPVDLNTKIVHQWQYYNETKKAWKDSSRIVLPITGGRDQGFRTYSFKQAVSPGLWRVKVMTIRGQELGQVGFKVEKVLSQPALVTKTI